MDHQPRCVPGTTSGPERRGRLFDEFQVGEIVRSPARTVTQAEITAFAGLSGDFNPLHIDEEFARSTPFRGRIAHGLLVQSIGSGLANQTGAFDGTVAAVVEMLIRYKAPVYPDDTVHIELLLAEKDPAPSPKRGWLRFESRVFNQRGELISDGHWVMLMHRRRLVRRSRSRGALERDGEARNAD